MWSPSRALAAMMDVVVPPDQVPERLTHRKTYDLAPDAPALALIGSREISGPDLTVDPMTPIVIAPPLRGAGGLRLLCPLAAWEHPRPCREAVKAGEVLGLLSNTGNTDAAHLHFQLADGPDVLTATSLPFVIDEWTLAGAVSLGGSRTENRVVRTPEPQTNTFPLEMTVADFP